MGMRVRRSNSARWRWTNALVDVVAREWRVRWRDTVMAVLVLVIWMVVFGWRCVVVMMIVRACCVVVAVVVPLVVVVVVVAVVMAVVMMVVRVVEMVGCGGMGDKAMVVMSWSV
jgi:hypothetical protein